MAPGNSTTTTPPASAIPSTRSLLSSLFSRLSEATTATVVSASPPVAPPDAGVGSSLLSSLPPIAQQLLLTFHCLLPSALLPALDLLDRGLVAQYTLASPAPEQRQHTYYVHSTAPSLPSDPRKFYSTPTARYEVRTQAWNCTCASFAFAACKAMGGRDKDGDGGESGVWGGYSRGGAPVCKHLLACVLAENCAVFAGFVVRREVDEMRLAELAVLWD